MLDNNGMDRRPCDGDERSVTTETADNDPLRATFNRSETSSDRLSSALSLAEQSAPSPVPLREALDRETAERRRFECLAKIQSDAVQLALDLLVSEPDIAGFFRAFTKTMVEECESHACGVWLIDDDYRSCDLWMAYLKDRMFTPGTDDWDAMALPRHSMAQHLFGYAPGWTRTIEYAGDDPRLPEPVREFNRCEGVSSVAVAPLVLATRTLGWFALSTGPTPACESAWRLALLEASARQATLALYQSRLAEQSLLEERHKAILEERNRLARDIHDTLAQGFAAILMQLQAAKRLDTALPPAVAASLDAAVDLARTHMIEARRSVGALRPHLGEGETLAATLRRLVDMAKRTTDVPIDLVVDELPQLGHEVEREIIGIAQEALNNAVRHADARRITVTASAPRSLGFRLSVADDGRGIGDERAASGFGMTSMQERAEHIGASLTIVTAARRGTEVVLAWEPTPIRSAAVEVHAAQ
jgi:signal transduction histidine kinase